MSDRTPLNEAAQGARARRIAAADVKAEGQWVAPGVSADGAEGGARRRPGFKRKPFGSREQKLNYPDRLGYHRHWFNDEPGRLIRAEEAGYEQVMDERTGKPVCVVVGIARGGGPLTAYLHEIPQDWYDEDMAAQERAVLDLKREIREGVFEKPDGVDGKVRYAGSKTMGDIRIDEGTRR